MRINKQASNSRCTKFSCARTRKTRTHLAFPLTGISITRACACVNTTPSIRPSFASGKPRQHKRVNRPTRNRGRDAQLRQNNARPLSIMVATLAKRSCVQIRDVYIRLCVVVVVDGVLGCSWQACGHCRHYIYTYYTHTQPRVQCDRKRMFTYICAYLYGTHAAAILPANMTQTHTHARTKAPREREQQRAGSCTITLEHCAYTTTRTINISDTVAVMFALYTPIERKHTPPQMVPPAASSHTHRRRARIYAKCLNLRLIKCAKIDADGQAIRQSTKSL